MKIALIGKMRSGKDSVGEYLTEKYGYKRYAFGDGIREIIEQFYPDVLEKGKPRYHLQYLGQALRHLDEDVWVKYLLKKVSTHEEYFYSCFKYYPNIVVTDTRQKNEVEKLRANGFIVVKIDCPQEIRLERMKKNGDNFSEKDLNHDTEKQVDLSIPDYTIVNDKGLEELYAEVDKLIRKVGLN